MTTYDARTEPEHPRLAKVWKMLVCRLDEFEMRVEGSTVIVVVETVEHRFPLEHDEARGYILETWGGHKRPSDWQAAPTLAAMSSEWMTTAAICARLGATKAATLNRLYRLHGAGKVEQRKAGRSTEWRLGAPK